jgi:hypothetical protein
MFPHPQPPHCKAGEVAEFEGGVIGALSVPYYVVDYYQYGRN